MPDFHRRFANKVVMITGAAQGIGRALAQLLAENGAHLGLIDKRAEAVEKATQELAQLTTVSGFHVDVRDSDSVERATRELFEQHGRIDIFINNAGIGVLGEARDHELDDWKEVIDTNLYGTIHGVTAVYPRMITQGGGHIVNVGSLAGAIPLPGNIAYVASKAGVVNLTLALRAEAKMHGIGVTLVTPVAVSTTMLAEAKSLHIDREAARRELVGPSITPQACARTILRGVVRNRAVIRPHLAGILWFLHSVVPFALAPLYRKVVATVARLRTAGGGTDGAP